MLKPDRVDTEVVSLFNKLAWDEKSRILNWLFSADNSDRLCHLELDSSSILPLFQFLGPKEEWGLVLALLKPSVASLCAQELKKLENDSVS